MDTPVLNLRRFRAIMHDVLQLHDAHPWAVRGRAKEAVKGSCLSNQPPLDQFLSRVKFFVATVHCFAIGPEVASP